MSLFAKIFSKDLSIFWALSTVITGCGLQLGFPRPDIHTGSNAFKEGYYTVSGALASFNYPLVVIKNVGAEVLVYQVANINRPSFNFGSRTTTPPAPVVLATLITRNAVNEYIGSIRASGTNLQLQSRQIVAADETKAGFPEVGSIISGQDYTLQPIALNAFLKQLRLIMNPATGTIFPVGDEDNCNGAFERSCAEVYFSALP